MARGKLVIGNGAVSRPRFKVHAVIQMEERDLSVEDIRTALATGEDIETRPDDEPYPARRKTR